MQQRQEIFTPRTDLASLEDFIHKVALFMHNDQKLMESTKRESTGGYFYTGYAFVARSDFSIELLQTLQGLLA